MPVKRANKPVKTQNSLRLWDPGGMGGGGVGGTGYHSKNLQKSQIYDVGPRWLFKVLIFSFF